MEVFNFVIVLEDYNVYFFDMWCFDCVSNVFKDYVVVVMDVEWFFIGEEFVFVGWDCFVCFWICEGGYFCDVYYIKCM